MYKAYKYLFYRIYSWNLKTWGEGDVPEYTAILVISLFMGFNLLSIFTFINLMAGYEIFKISEIPKSYIIIKYLILIFVNYFILVKGGKYIQIAKEFKKENKEARRIRTKLMWSYIIFTHLLLILLGYLFYLRLS